MRVMAMVAAVLMTWAAGSMAQGLQFPEMAGWKKSDDIQTFIPKTLYEYINGAADLYLSCDFEELQVAEYGNEQKASVIVETYRHRTPEGAFGIYSQERLPEGNYLNIGAEGYIEPHILNFVMGRYYVKMNSFNTGAGDREVLQLFAERIAERAGQKGALPAILSAFPVEGKRDHSEKKDLQQEASLPGLYCQGCRECLGQCVARLPIPDLMRAYMYVYDYRNLGMARDLVVSLGLPAEVCGDCSQCPVQCPSGFDVKTKIGDIVRVRQIPTEYIA